MKIRWMLAVLTITLTIPEAFTQQDVWSRKADMPTARSQLSTLSPVGATIGYAIFRQATLPIVQVVTRSSIDSTMTEPMSHLPLSQLRIGGQIILGAIGGIAGTVGSRMIVCGLLGRGANYDELGRTLWLIDITGSTLVSATTVYSIGTIGNQTGSFWATLVGSTVGGLIQFPVFEATGATLIPLLTYPIQSALATYGFCRTRRWDTHETALINSHDRRISVMVPRVSLELDPYYEDALIWRVDLVAVRF